MTYSHIPTITFQQVSQRLEEARIHQDDQRMFNRIILHLSQGHPYAPSMLKSLKTTYQKKKLLDHLAKRTLR